MATDLLTQDLPSLTPVTRPWQLCRPPAQGGQALRTCSPPRRWPRLLRALCSIPVRTLFCPRAVLEVLAVLRRVSSHCCRVCDQVAACVELRRRQWEDRSLRSRQRRNYLRLVHRCVLLALLGGAMVGRALLGSSHLMGFCSHFRGCLFSRKIAVGITVNTTCNFRIWVLQTQRIFGF